MEGQGGVENKQLHNNNNASVVVVVASHHEIEAEIAILFYALPLASPQANVVFIELLAKGPSDQ